jgi:hypothetical protein
MPAVIVWLASYPRSGNTMFRMNLWQRHGLKTYSLYKDLDFDHMGASSTVGHSRLPAPVAELKASKKVYLVKTHELPEDDLPAVYIVRDGRDASVSLAHYYRAAPYLSSQERAERAPPPFDEVLRRTIVDGHEGKGWSGHVDAWLERRGPLHLVRYEDLTASPDTLVDQAMAALGLRAGRSPLRKLSRRSGPGFEEINRMWPDFFRRGKSQSWRDEMSSQIHELFWEHHGATMEALGYAR